MRGPLSYWRLFSAGFYTLAPGSWRHSWWIRTPWFGVLCFNGYPEYSVRSFATGIEIAWKRDPRWAEPRFGGWLFIERRTWMTHELLEWISYRRA